VIASSRANGYCPGRCCNPNLLGCATLPREECTVTTGLQEKIHCLPHALAIEALATPAEAGNLPQGGFRALALPPGVCSDRHVLCSFGAALPELGGLTLWLMLRVSPCTRPAVFTFTVSAPRFRFDNNRMARMRLSNCIQGLRLIASSAARCDCLAVDGMNYTHLARHCQYPASTRRPSADTRVHHTYARGHAQARPGNHSGATPRGAAAGWLRSATACGRLLIRI